MSSQYRIVRRWEKDCQPENVRLCHREAPSGPVAEDQPASGDAPPARQLTPEELASLQKLAACYDKSLEYVLAKSRPWRFIWINLLLGMAKGFGVAIGITILAFIALKILMSLQILNLPIIGDFIAELLDYINNIRNFGS